MTEPAERMWPWIAAILDIQGHVIMKKNQSRATKQVVIMAESRHRQVISRLCSYTGTNVELKNQPSLPSEWMRRGCVEHCPEAHVHLQAEDKPMPLTSRWTVTGASAAIVLHSVRPFLVSWDEKGYGDAYEQVLEDVVLTGQGSGATRSGIRRLMGLGWPVPPGWLDTLTESAREMAAEAREVSDDTAAILALAGRK